jgi:hypothetical protein
MVERTAYAYLTILLLSLWPLILLIWWSNIALIIPLIVLSIALLIFVWKRCSSGACSLLLGFEVISAKLASGCANISILYVPVVLVGVYFICIFYTLNSLWRGHEYAQSHWVNFVHKFIDKEGQAKEIASIAQRELRKSGIPAKVTVRFQDEEGERYGEFVKLNCVGCKFADITTVEWGDGPHDFYRKPCLHPEPHVVDQYHCLSRVPEEGKS